MPRFTDVPATTARLLAGSSRQGYQGCRTRKLCKRRRLMARRIRTGLLLAVLLAPAAAFGQAPAAPAPPRPHWFEVPLRSDGFFAGQVLVYDGDIGRLRPANSGSISVYRRGNLLNTVRVGENGRFQVAGLAPGVYS